MAGSIVIRRDCVIDAPTTDEAVKLYRKTIGYNDSITIEGDIVIKVRGKVLKNPPALR